MFDIPLHMAPVIRLKTRVRDDALNERNFLFSEVQLERLMYRLNYPIDKTV